MLLLLGAPLRASAADQVTDPALTAYLKSADSVCLTARKQMAATLPQYELHKAASKSVRGGKGTKLATPKEVQAYIEVNLVSLQNQQSKLKLLKAPTATQAQINKLYVQADQALAEIKKNPTKTPFTDPLRPVATAAKLIGFTECYQSHRPTL